MASSQGPHFSPHSTVNTNNYLQSEIKVMSVSAPDVTSLHHCIQNHHQYFTIFN